MPTCPDTNLTGNCEPPFPPVTPTPTVASPFQLCRCEDSIDGLTGIGTFDNYVTGNAFLVDVFVRKDVSNSGTTLEDSFFIRWPAPVSGDHYDTTDVASCGFGGTLYVLRGQWIVFRQQDPSNASYPIVISTAPNGEADYVLTGSAPEDGAIVYRDGTATGYSAEYMPALVQ